MCFLTVSSRPCLETSPHSILRTPFSGHCLGALWRGKPCPAELSEGVNRVFRTLSGDTPLPILQTPSAGHCLDTHGNLAEKKSCRKKTPKLSVTLVKNEKISPKRKFSGRTSRGHPGVICADVPTQKFGQGSQNPGKTSILARTSMTRRRGRP